MLEQQQLCVVQEQTAAPAWARQPIALLATSQSPPPLVRAQILRQQL